MEHESRSHLHADSPRPVWRVRGAFAVPAVVAALGAWAVAAAASQADPTAVGVRVGDHPAFVRAVIRFVPGRLAGRQVQATDPEAFGGTARLRVTQASVRSQILARRAEGVTVRVNRDTGGARIDISAAPGRFKYLSYAVVTSNRLAIDLWKSAPPTSAAAVRRAPDGCLTLDTLLVAPGVVTAGGREANLFEHQFRVVLRDRDGRVLSRRPVVASAGRWSAQLSYRTTRRQSGTLEAAALSAKDGALACLVQARVTLPTTDHGSTSRRFSARASTDDSALRVVYRARADVDGDGRVDLVRLRTGSPSSPGRLLVDLGHDRDLAVPVATDAVYLPGLVAAGDVDGRPGAELFVDAVHVTTAETIAIYTYWGGQLRRAGALSAYGADAGIRFGIACQVRGSRRLVVEHELWQPGSRKVWLGRDTTYAWAGPALRLSARGRARFIGSAPPRALIGVHCGHPAAA